jgi:hypothetical protein
MYSCDIFSTYRAFLAVVRDPRVDIERRCALVFLRWIFGSKGERCTRVSQRCTLMGHLRETLVDLSTLLARWT